MTIPEQNDPALEGWSPADVEWLDSKVPAELRHVAIRHKRELFSLCMQAGILNYAMSVLASQCRGNQAGSKAVMTIQPLLDNLMKVALQAKGHSMEQFLSCKADIELVGAMAAPGQGGSGPRSPGGIILNG